MDVLTVTIFVSLLLVAAGVVLFVWRLRSGDFEHGDRLSLLPLNDDDRVVGAEDAAGADDTDDDDSYNSQPRRGGSA